MLGKVPLYRIQMNNHLKIILILVLSFIVNNGLLGQSNPAMNQLIQNAVAAQ